MKNRNSLAMVIYVLILTGVLCCLPLMWLTPSFVIDDALYYLRVPQNVVAGYGVTYDRQGYTNGFHPLWAALVLPLAMVAGEEHLLLLRMGFLACGVFVALGVLSLYGLSRRLHWSSAGAVVAVAVLSFPRMDLWLSLMESGPSMGILLLTLYLCHRHELLTTEGFGLNLLFGLLMALVFLVRLDQVFIVVMMFVGSLYMRVRMGQSLRKLVRSILAGGLLTTLLVLPYLATNLYYFGNVVPVSGLKKHVLADSVIIFMNAAIYPLQAVSNKVELPGWVMAVLLLAAFAVGLFVVESMRARGKDVPRICAGGVIPFFALGVIARFVYLRIFVSHESARVPWYWVPEYVLFSIITGYFVACAVRRFPKQWRSSRAWGNAGYAATLGIAAVGTLYVFVDAARLHKDNTTNLVNALWAKEHIPSDRLYAMYDSGIFSFFSQFNTVPLNGLISDVQTMLESKDRRYNDIMKRFNVDYLVVNLDDEQVAEIPSGGVLHKADRKFDYGPHRDQRLCIVDRRIYSPFEK